MCRSSPLEAEGNVKTGHPIENGLKFEGVLPKAGRRMRRHDA